MSAWSRMPKGVKTMLVMGLVMAFGWMAFEIIPGMAEDRDDGVPAGGYVLEFAGDFSPGLAARDDLGISVVVAMDVSGSMSNPPDSGGDDKYKQAAAALGEVVEVLDRLVKDAPEGQVLKVGVITFSGTVNDMMPLTVMDADGIRLLRKLAANPMNFSPNGSTAIGLAIQRGSEMLAQSGTVLRSLIVVTDGENTEGIAPAPVLEAVYANRNSAGTEDLPVYTNATLVSFVGFDIGSGPFHELANLGARVTSAADRSQLAATLSRLLEADVTKLEAPALGGSP